MSEVKLKQLYYERDTWKRLLAFIGEENNYFKNRLTEILKEKFNGDLLEETEAFQNSFVKEDELIMLLRNDIAELDDLAEREIVEDGNIIKEVKYKMDRLRSNIRVAEKQFLKLKATFNDYFSENL